MDQQKQKNKLEAKIIDMSNIEEYSYLWDGSQSGWVVLKDVYENTIFNKETKSVLLVEDEDLNNRLAAMMIMNNCQVISKYSEIEKILKDRS